MNNSVPADLSDKEIIDEFVKWAEIAGTSTNNGNLQKSIRAVRRLGELGRILYQRGPEVRLMLLPFLTHPQEGVRHYVAHELLAVSPVEARTAIEKMAKGIGPIPSDARGTIRMLDSGQYKPR